VIDGVKLVVEPSVFPVGALQLNPDGLQAFLDSQNITQPLSPAPSAGETLVETAGRLCYMSFQKPRPGGNASYIQHILEVGHGSVLEHAVFSFIITGVDRNLSHELVRHRVGLSPSQLSQRYVDEANVAACGKRRNAERSQLSQRYVDEASTAFVVTPRYVPYLDAYKAWCAAERPFERSQAVILFQAWLDTCKRSLNAYKDEAQIFEADSTETNLTRRRKQAREAARGVLPGCTETFLFLTGNARAWRHLLELRGSADADLQFQRLARALLPHLQHQAPHLFSDFTTTATEITAQYRKV
jgi:thymidylate synthase (FAD)